MIVKLEVMLKAGKESFRPGYYSDEGKGHYPLVNENGLEIPEAILREVEAGANTVTILSLPTETKSLKKPAPASSDVDEPDESEESEKEAPKKLLAKRK